MFTKSFWTQTAERAVKSAVQMALLMTAGATGFDLFTLDPARLALGALGAAILSVLTSLASAPFGNTATPSVVNTNPTLPIGGSDGYPS
jgi:hypothetical protein